MTYRIRVWNCFHERIDTLIIREIIESIHDKDHLFIVNCERNRTIDINRIESLEVIRD